MSQANDNPQTEKEVVDAELSHYVDGTTTDEINDMSLEELQEYAKGLSDLNWRISAQYSNKLHLLQIEVKKTQALRVELAEWRHAARRLFHGAHRSLEWIKTVKVNTEHLGGFTHHMKDVVHKLNVNIIESVESELEQPTERVRELLVKDGGMSDIPF